jgi:ABC-type dipeptide/oligopeptide/nickel transport system ATPase component
MLKRQQYLKRELMVLSTLKIKKLEDQKGRLDGMDAIKDALTQTIQKNKQLSKQPEEVIDPSTDSLKSNKAKQKIAQKEMTHMNLVLQHPSFKSNPFATMQEHLRNSLAKQAEEQEITAKSERIQEAIQTAEKKVARKERIRDAKFEKTRRKGRRRR